MNLNGSHTERNFKFPVVYDIQEMYRSQVTKISFVRTSHDGPCFMCISLSSGHLHLSGN